ncbi:zinc ribbon domain-containing protein [Salsuginibacillus kocurii]|uniref:zinc ribbon domain-containing protein n=1 Tax=Salsuginibacillus kocurii TaxID=427078 RepID=UPI00037C8661|nr:zinc ribbon domain-containing protein [Salsuginibacillus kocurii]
MQCPKCFTINEDEALFCASCGSPIPVVTNEEESQPAESHLTIENQPIEPIAPGTTSKVETASTIGNEPEASVETSPGATVPPQVTQGPPKNDFFNTYKDFCFASIKQPWQSSLATNHSHLSFGIINMVLASFFIIAALYLTTPYLLMRFTLFIEQLDPTGMTGGGAASAEEISAMQAEISELMPGFFELSMQPLFILGAGLFGVTFLSYFLLQSTGKQLDWKDMMGRFGSFLALPMSLALLAVVLTFVNLESFASFLLLLSFMLLVLALAASIFSYQTQQPGNHKFDVVFLAAITGAALLFIQYYAVFNYFSELIALLSGMEPPEDPF